MIIPLIAIFNHTGYIAGTADGIVSIQGQPASRKIHVLHADTLQWLQTAVSLNNGHYLITNLDPNQRYIIMCRDYARQFEPVVWDQVIPADDLSLEQQQALWDSWTLPS